MTITPCPTCRCTKAFGPAAVVFAATETEPEVTVQYVNCRRCGAMLVLGRDVEEVHDAVR